jgi:hypothetical protein
MRYSATADTNNQIIHGFNLAKFVFYAYGDITKKTDWLAAIYVDEFHINFYELTVNHRFTNAFQVKAGQFGPPGVRSGAAIDSMYTSINLNFTERPLINSFWCDASALHDQRTFGIQVHGFPVKKLYYANGQQQQWKNPYRSRNEKRV